MTFEAVQVRDDSYTIDAEDIVRVRDAYGTQIMYSEALVREEALRHEMALIGTQYLRSFKEKGVADRAAVLEDLYQSEAAYYESLKLVLDVYLESYEHCADGVLQQRLAQTMMDLMSRRPLLDLKANYLSDSYSSQVVAVQLEASLLREIVSAQMSAERQYRNTIAARHAQLDEAQRFGFPTTLYQSGTHEELLGEQPIYYPTPGSDGIGPLDLYQSLDSVVGVKDVLECVVKELSFIHRLAAAAELTAMKTVVLQQALIEWRLLVQEEDLTEELSKKAGDEIARRPYANNFLIDDPFAMDGIIDQVQLNFDHDAEQAEKKMAGKPVKKHPGQSAGKKEAPAPVEPRLVFHELNHPSSMMQAHMNAIEAVLLRKKLLESIYESEIVQQAYRAQAAIYKKELIAEAPAPIEFVHVSDTELSGSRQKQIPMEEVSSLGADFATRLALLEFDVQLAGFDFQTVPGLKETLHEKPFFLRKALRLQVLERGMVAIALEYNQAALDRCMEAVVLKEDSLHSSAGAMGGARAFAGGGGGGERKGGGGGGLVQILF